MPFYQVSTWAGIFQEWGLHELYSEVYVRFRILSTVLNNLIIERRFWQLVRDSQQQYFVDLVKCR